MLLRINERKRWTIPPPTDPKARAQQDEEIFQTARLVNCGWFGSIVFSDYLSAILGLARYGNNWSLDPFDEIRNSDHTFVGRGQGNACSVEVNIGFLSNQTKINVFYQVQHAI